MVDHDEDDDEEELAQPEPVYSIGFEVVESGTSPRSSGGANRGRRGGEAPSPKRSALGPASTGNTSQASARMSTLRGALCAAEREAVCKALDEAGKPLIAWQIAERSGIRQQRMEKILPVLVEEGCLKRLDTASAVKYSRA